MKKDLEDIGDLDFGFSFLDEDYENGKEENEKLKQEYHSSLEEVERIQKRLNDLYELIEPFLDNLCKNPERSTIHWPNRAEKIQKFKEKLKNIVEGNEYESSRQTRKK
jgi:hypothetical protein